MIDSHSSSRDDPLAPPAAPTNATGRKAPVPKRKKPGPYRLPPRERRNGLLIVNTGDGKGKTTAALGILLRATGRGMRVAMFQFLKRMTNAGEHRAAERLGVEIVPLGISRALGGTDTTDDVALARAGWEHCKLLMLNGMYDVLILDELTLPLKWNWIDTGEVTDAIAARPTGTHVIITGRHAPQMLMDAADLVTDMRVIKHPFRDRHLLAQAGIDV